MTTTTAAAMPHDDETKPLEMPAADWSKGRLNEYCRSLDAQIRGLERRTLAMEFYWGAAAEMIYQKLNGSWTSWAKGCGYPKETFRRRRLLYLRAGSLDALEKYRDNKMEAYYELGIMIRPSKSQIAEDTPDISTTTSSKTEDTTASTTPDLCVKADDGADVEVSVTVEGNGSAEDLRSLNPLTRSIV